MSIRTPKDLAQLVRNERNKLQLSQTDIAERGGLLQKTISGFENNPEGTKLATLFQILSAHNLTIQILPQKWENEW